VFEKALGDMMGAVKQTNEEADLEFIRQALRGSKLMQFAQAEQDMEVESARQYALTEPEEALDENALSMLRDYSNMEGFDNPSDFLFMDNLPQEGSDDSEDGALPEGLDEADGEALDGGDDEELDELKPETGLDGTATADPTGWETQVPGLKPDEGVLSYFQLPVPDKLFAGGNRRP
jgi:hypothetical protein